MRPTFLEQVAAIYAAELKNTDKSRRITFIFPNRRSCRFFDNDLYRLLNPGKEYDPTDEKCRQNHPYRVATLTGIAVTRSGCTEASRHQAIFALYNAYRLHCEDIRFDSFLYWGSMLLDDFNDVDNNLVDPAKLFVNAKRWKEIQSTYLTDLQREIIRRYWGEVIPANEADNFWKHTDNESVRNADRFVRMWEVLLPVYNDFHAGLRNADVTTEVKRGKTTEKRRGLMTRAAMMRDLCRRLETDSKKIFPDDLYVFIGFDFPTGCEFAIFNHLKREGRADFYWDFNSPVANGGQQSALSRTFSSLKKDFPSRCQLPEPPITRLPKILIKGSPSEVAQAKIVGQQLHTWIEEGAVANAADARDTAVVLPDESLLMAVTHAIPAEITDMNVTMGAPMRITPIGGLVGIILGLQLSARSTRGERTYFHEPVEQLLANPTIQLVAPEECDALLGEIRNGRLFTVGADMIADRYPKLVPFFPRENVQNDIDDAIAFIRNVVAALTEALSDGSHLLETNLLGDFMVKVEAIYDAAKRFDVGMADRTFLYMLRRIIDTEIVNFEGEPLKGLQVMGVLETRALDFRNIIITSMNERIFPKRAQIRSFIPESLRRAYGLPTSDLNERRYTYYFYHMLSRAENVVLTYDTRTGGLRSADISRFITQMLYLYNKEARAADSPVIRHEQGYFPTSPIAVEPIEIRKTDRIMKLLKRYTDPTPGPDGRTKAFSASLLKHYLTCPMQFYLRDLRGISTDDEILDYMEASTFGTIVHAVFQNLYEELTPSGHDGFVSSEVAERWLNDKSILLRHVTQAINKEFNRLDDIHLSRILEGESKVVSQAIIEIVEAVIRNELKGSASYPRIVPFTFKSAEEVIDSQWKVKDRLKINFRQVIDRLDVVDGRLRIVDYKTGDVKNNIGHSFDKMFDVGSKNEKLSIFQVLLYCVLYKNKEGYTDAIEPMIYNLFSVAKSGLCAITKTDSPHGKAKRITDYREVEEEFTARLNALLTEIFDPEVPFRQTPHDDNCKFCDFLRFCGRNPRE